MPPVSGSEAAVPQTAAAGASALVRCVGLRKEFPAGSEDLLGRKRLTVKAVDGIDLEIMPGETVGLVGESGSGKSTLGRLILKLIEPTAGKVFYDGRDLATLSRSELRQLRRQMQIVFQDPYSSLNPRMRVRAIVGEGLEIHRMARGRDKEDRIVKLLARVGMGSEALDRYPREFSGGQRQRIGIARALAVSPQLIVCDEPVSALDVSIQAQVINLLEDLQEKFNLTYLFIAHDLSVVEHTSTRIAVMYLGRIVEIAPARELYTAPKHPYTEALLSAVPIPDPSVSRRRIVLEGDVPNPIRPPSGCHFHPRCPRAEERCAREAPLLRQIAPGRLSACHFST
jgi:oligopeptide transport system ATP-binding protein